jgi:hypothetical protein
MRPCGELVGYLTRKLTRSPAGGHVTDLIRRTAADAEADRPPGRDRESRAEPLFLRRFQARHDALSTCDRSWTTHRATHPRKRTGPGSMPSRSALSGNSADVARRTGADPPFPLIEYCRIHPGPAPAAPAPAPAW